MALSQNLQKALKDEVAQLRKAHSAKSAGTVSATATDWLTVVLTFLSDIFELLLELLI